MRVFYLSFTALAVGAAVQVQAAGSAAAANSEKPRELATVNVTGSRSDKPFQTAGAVSYRDADLFGQDMNEVLRNIPGTFSQHDIGQGGFAVNIRGLEGLGRVNTSIDGVTQTFFQANPAHGWNGQTTYVPDDFIAGLEVQRGAAAGAAGAGSLGGSADFRTIDVDDLVVKDRSYGGRLIYRQGSNGYGKNAMAAAAARFESANGGSIGFLSAVSGKRKYGYKNGAGEVIAGDEFDVDTPMESGLKSWASLNKIQWRPNRHHSITLSHLFNRSRFRNNHSPLQVDTQTGLLKYRYKPLSDWVDLHADIAYGKSKQQFLTGEAAYESYVGRSTENPNFSAVLQNQSIIDAGSTELTLNYGAKIMRTRYTANLIEDKSLIAEGKQSLNAAFVDFDWGVSEHFGIQGGLHYDQYRVQGYLPPTEDNGTIILPKGGNINFTNKSSRFNPRINFWFKPADWLTVYAGASRTSRGPSVQEIIYPNNLDGKPYSVNPYLQGEQANNRDIGLNIFKQGVWSADDRLRFKADYFYNKVKNYILQDQFYICGSEDLSRCTFEAYVASDDSPIAPVGVYRNIPDTTKMHGWEIEGGYDFGRAYINVTYSKTKTDFPVDQLADGGFSHVRALPEKSWKIDIGTRWLDKRLTIGGRVQFFGRDSVAAGTDSDTNLPTVRYEKAGPKIIDLYASYKLDKRIMLFVNADNVTNRVYNYPLSGGTLGVGNLGDDNNANAGTGRGRTVYGGIKVQF